MIGLEHLADGSISDRNFQKLMGLVPDSGGESTGFRFGVTDVTLTASTEGSATVTHGLGKTPVVVLLTPSAATSASLAAQAHSLSSTTFEIQLVRSASTSATYPVFWLVVG